MVEHCPDSDLTLPQIAKRVDSKLEWIVSRLGAFQKFIVVQTSLLYSLGIKK